MTNLKGWIIPIYYHCIQCCNNMTEDENQYSKNFCSEECEKEYNLKMKGGEE